MSFEAIVDDARRTSNDHNSSPLANGSVELIKHKTLAYLPLCSTHMRNENSTHSMESPYVKIAFFHTTGKNSLQDHSLWILSFKSSHHFLTGTQLKRITAHFSSFPLIHVNMFGYWLRPCKRINSFYILYFSIPIVEDVWITELKVSSHQG